MEWGTETQTAIISASPPPRGPVQGAASPTPDSGFRARGTAEFLASAVTSPDDRGVLAEPITDGLYAVLNCIDATMNYGTGAELRHGQRDQITSFSPRGAEIRPVGSGVHVDRRYESRP